MGEHEGHHPVRLEDPLTLREDGSHALLIVATRTRLGALLTLESSHIGDRLVVLIGQVAAEEFREDVASCPLEPDVEEVRQFRVHDVVVVRGIHDDRVDAGVLDVIEAVAGLAGDRDGRRGSVGLIAEEFAVVAVLVR